MSKEEKQRRSEYINIFDKTTCTVNARFKCDCCVVALFREDVTKMYDELQAYYDDQCFLSGYESFLRTDDCTYFTEKYIEAFDERLEKYSALAFAFLERIREVVNVEECVILHKLERLFDGHERSLKTANF